MNLTDRQSASGISTTDLIHIVITGDTSQSPAGSSYKVEIGDYASLFSSPDTFVTGGTFNQSGGTATFTNNTGGTFNVTGFTGVFENNIPVVLNAGDSLGRYHNGDIIPASGKTIEWILNDIATDYINPTFSNLTRTNYSPIILDVGDVMVGGSQTFTWATTTPNNINPTSLTLSQNVSGSTIIGTNLAYNGGSGAFTTTDVITSTSRIENKVIYTIAGLNTHAGSFSRTLTASWRNRLYYGKNTLPDLTAIDVTGLTNSSLVVGVTSTFINVGASVGSYVYIIIPTAFPQPSDFRDSVSGCFGNNIPFTNLGTVNITKFGVTTTYNKYRSINTIDGSLNVWMCA